MNGRGYTMWKKGSAEVMSLLFSCSHAAATSIDISGLVGPDPWEIHYDHITADHPECSAVSGSVSVGPDDVRFLAFYDDTHKDPMVLSPVGDQPRPNIVISNATCRLGLSVSRGLGWNKDGESAPGTVGKNENRPSAQLPEMLAVINYADPNVSYTPLGMPFFLDHNSIYFPNTHRLLGGYKVSMRAQADGRSEDMLIERPGCSVTIRLTLQILHDAAWQTSTFRH